MQPRLGTLLSLLLVGEEGIRSNGLISFGAKDEKYNPTAVRGNQPDPFRKLRIVN
jgi:hypothetical protein